MRCIELKRRFAFCTDDDRVRTMREPFFGIMDLEMTGRNPFVHEILEIGMVICDRTTLELIERFEVKIRPEHLERAEQEALAVNHFSEEEWKDALPISEAFPQWLVKMKDAKPAGWNLGLDREFLDYASWQMRGKLIDELPYSWFEIKSFAEEQLLEKQEWERFGLPAVAEYLGIPHPNAHHALADAEAAWRVFRKLRGFD